MRAALVIALKDLRQRLRDRSALVIAFAAPLGLALIVTAAFGSGFSGNFEATFLVVDQDQSQISKAFTQQVLGAPQFKDQITVVPVATPTEARRLIREDETLVPTRGSVLMRVPGIGAAFIIPKGFSGAVVGNRKATMTVLRDPDFEIAAEVATALANAYTGQINAGRLSVLTAVRARAGSREARPSNGPVDPAAVADLARAAASERIPIELVDGNVGIKKVSGASYFGPAMAIFFLFFTTSFAARSLLSEREQGTLPRVLAAPIKGVSVIAGKALTALFIGLVSLGVMFTTFGLLLDIDWGNPLTLLVVSVATVLSVMGVTAVVQLFARTQAQADAYSQVVGVLFALIGGSFFPLFQMPEAIQRISVIAPNAWALRAFNDIVYDGAKLTDLGTHLSVILAFAAVTGGAAFMRARRLSLR